MIIKVFFIDYFFKEKYNLIFFFQYRSGNTIALSFDHKPNHPIEFKRIYDSGGFVRFNGVWRVAGILACSRALGIYEYYLIELIHYINIYCFIKKAISL